MTLDASQVADAYRRFGHLVFRRCRVILRDPLAAEDAMQEVFVRLMRYGSSFLTADSPVAWLYRVADRVCFDQLRARRRDPNAEPELCNRLHTPNDGVSRFLDRDLVLRFLERFDRRTQQVAVLYFVDEMSQEEIAGATGWSRQTVNKKLAHVRQRAEALRGYLEGRG